MAKRKQKLEHNGVTANIELVAPEQAERWLLRNPRNRGLSEANVRRLVRAIEEGTWQLNGTTIIIDSADNLIDGQHRLEAIVRTGTPALVIVVRNVDPSVFDTIDVGKRRSPADTLSVLGEINCSALAGALVNVDAYCLGNMRRTQQYANTDMETLLNRYPKVRASVAVAMKPENRGRLLGRVPFAALHYVFSELAPRVANRWLPQLVDGTNIKANTGLHWLRKRLVENAMDRDRSLSKRYVFALAIKAWNADRNGKVVKSLRYTDAGDNAESFPVAH